MLPAGGPPTTGRTRDRISRPQEALYRTDRSGKRTEPRTPGRTSRGMDFRADSGDTSSDASRLQTPAADALGRCRELRLLSARWSTGLTFWRSRTKTAPSSSLLLLQSCYRHNLCTASTVTVLTPSPIGAAGWAAKVVRADRPPHGLARPNADLSDQAEFHETLPTRTYFREVFFIAFRLRTLLDVVSIRL